VIGTPLFIIFGSLSDKIGRKYIMMAGMILGVLCYRPIYQRMFSLTDIAKKVEIESMRSIERNTTFVSGDTVVTSILKKTYTDQTQVAEITKTTHAKDGAKKDEVKKETSLDGDNYWMMVILIAIQVVFVTMVYGPIAAFLVELFPTRIRYTSMSLPYHIGNGIFGGLTPFIATMLYENSKSDSNPTGDPIAGLWYPIIVAGICFVIGMIS
jgi:MHS family proline/betaine transporter-like MFS transporter